ncbi:MAG: hypothetical protein ACYCVZ_11095 [Streptosporangiaceae bacterium]
MTYTYKRTEPGLWTVGDYDPSGRWQPESDHDSPQDAAQRTAWLNGSGQPPAPPAGLLLTPKDKRLLLAALDDAATYRTERAGTCCGACESADAGMCDEHADDVDQAEAYRALAGRIGGAS